jgi:hypothetical protein
MKHASGGTFHRSRQPDVIRTGQERGSRRRVHRYGRLMHGAVVRIHGRRGNGQGERRSRRGREDRIGHTVRAACASAIGRRVQLTARPIDHILVDAMGSSLTQFAQWIYQVGCEAGVLILKWIGSSRGSCIRRRRGRRSRTTRSD